MASRYWLVLVVGLMLPAATGSAQTPAPSQAPGTGPVYAVTYFEVAPKAARQTAGLLRSFAAATRKEDGNAELTIVHEIGRPGRFAVVEAWRDKAALEAHAAAMKALGDKLRPNFASPFDARQFGPLSIAQATGDAGAGAAIYVLTHVDVFPAGKDQVAAMVKDQTEASRKDAGALRFDAVVWDGHPNHFHLIEAWTDRAAREAHALADHSRDFRAKLVPFEGALYDERLYTLVR